MQASMSQPGIRQPEIMQPGGLQAGMKTQVDMEQSERDDGAAATVTAKALLAGEVSGKVPRLHGTVEKRGSGRGLLGTVRWKSKLLVVLSRMYRMICTVLSKLTNAHTTEGNPFGIY